MSFLPLAIDPPDYVLIAGKKTPGLAEVSDASKKFKWEERKGVAKTGSYPAFRGMELARFTITIRLFTEEDWAAWHAFRPMIERMPDKKRNRAFDVWHPILEDLNISSINIEEISQPIHAGAMEYYVTIKCIEFRPPRTTVSVVKSADTKPKSEAEVLDAADIQIMQEMSYGDKLRAEYNGL